MLHAPLEPQYKVPHPKGGVKNLVNRPFADY